MKKRGRKHSIEEMFLMKQVAKKFEEVRETKGAKAAAKELKVSLPSFYNYLAGSDLPRIEVLRRTREIWHIKWDQIDPSQLLQTRKIASAEQLAFSFIDAITQDDITVGKIGREGKKVLRVTFDIKFPA